MPSVRTIAAGLAGVLATLSLGVLPGVGLPPTAAQAAPPDPSSQVGAPARPAGARSAESALVDRVPTPRLHWRPCTGDGRQAYGCATVPLPLDYDDPTGPSVELALLKVPATDPAHRIGSLFLNPGGPGGSGKDIAVRAAGFLSAEVTARFDLIGMDPRGTNDSTRVQCYPDEAEQRVDTAVLLQGFPVGRRAERAYVRAAGNLARRCSTAGEPLASSMSTTEVARDLDVLRRAVGDRRLSYLGWSYGTYLGQLYAAMFPDRFRVLAIDGVVDAVAWQGTPATADIPLTMRLRSGEGSWRALAGVLDRCRRAGSPACPLMPDPRAAFADLADALRRSPISVPLEDGSTVQITYPDFVLSVLFALYAPEGAEAVPELVNAVRQLGDPAVSGARRQVAATRWSRLVDQSQARLSSGSVAPPTNDFELGAAVLCSDSRNPVELRRWSQLAARADRSAPYFGRHWLWGSAFCARSAWRAVDEDAFHGPFDRWTSRPVLVVGNTFDPATNVDAAVAVARRLPNSRLLVSRSWGHTAYGTSACATGAVDRYLLTGALPARGTRCVGDVQPFGIR